MTEVLTVPTHFGDLSELSEGLIDRVGDGSLILYGATPFAQGDHVGFRVLLSDESTALEGYGLVSEVYDGGAEREPETRYDIVFGSLELDGRNEVVFERIILARQSMAGDAPATGEVDISELEEQVADIEVDAGFANEDAGPVFDDATEFATEAPAHELEEAFDAAPPAEFESVPEDAFESLAPEAYPEEEVPAPPIDVAPPRIALGGTADGPLIRPVFAASWWPRAEAPEPRPATGWFQYEAGTLPVPPSAPRPELSSELRVSPAPRPGEAAAAEPPQAPPAHYEEMPLPDGDVDIAPAVEAEYVSVGDAEPQAEEHEFAVDAEVPFEGAVDDDLQDMGLEIGEEPADGGLPEESFADVNLDEDEPEAFQGGDVGNDYAEEELDVEIDV